MALFCECCFEAPELRQLVAQRGGGIPNCPICGAENVKALNAEDGQLQGLIRALIRYHFAEWEYNTHWGGDGLESLLFKPNPITAYRQSWPNEIYEEALLPSIQDGYMPFEEGISLYAGYDSDGHQNMLLSALKNEEHPLLHKLSGELKRKNYFLLEDQAKELLAPHALKLERWVEIGTTLYRARIGYESRMIPQMSFGEGRHYKPFSGDELGAPPPHLAGGGRLNRPGVSYMYLATDEHTALCEVRPHPGHKVSVGEFRCTRRLRVANFNAISVADYALSDRKLNDFVLLKSIDDIFSLPVTPENRNHYSFSQFLSDALREMGFDGIVYRSSVGKGTNYAFFDSSAFSYEGNSARVINVVRLEYLHSDLSQFNENTEYMTRPDGSYYS